MLPDSGLHEDAQSKHPSFNGIIVEEQNATGTHAIAFATYFNSYSTWQGKVFYLMNIFVRAEHRGKGVGKQLFTELMKIAKRTNCHRFEFHANNKNYGAIVFYEKLGIINLTATEGWDYFEWEPNKNELTAGRSV